MSAHQTTSPACVITTSWDDGHPLDLRLAELLSKYGLPGTFYAPLRSQRETMSAAQIRELSGSFEIGGHTVSHVDLNSVPLQTGKDEIAGCKQELEAITGRACESFCFPLGHYRAEHLAEVKRCGFTLARTVELMSFDFPRKAAGIAVVPTTVQAYASGQGAVMRNGLKRLNAGNLLRALRCRRDDWSMTADRLLDEFWKTGGVFHLWGHSWEIEESGDWQRLESVFSRISEFRSQAVLLNNHDLLSHEGWTRGSVRMLSSQVDKAEA